MDAHNDLDIQLQQVQSQILMAIKNGDEASVQEWLAQQPPADVNMVFEQGMTALHHAVRENKERIVEILLEANADCSIFDEKGWTPLHYAAKSGNSSIMSKLLDKVQTIELRKQVAEPAKMRDKYVFDTPVNVAAQWGHAKVLKKMIEKNPSCVNFTGRYNETPLHQAAQYGHLEAAEAIFQSSVSPRVNARSSPWGKTALHAAAVSGKLEITKLLVEKNAELDPNPEQKSPFHKAVLFGNTEVALYLLAKGARVTPSSFADIVNEDYKDLAIAVIKRKQWPLALRGTFECDGKVTTIFRELIKKMPDVAEMVLNQSMVVRPKDRLKQIPEYSVLYNYEFIEDFEDGIESEIQNGELTSTLEGGSVAAEEDGTETYNCGFDDVDSKAPPSWPSSHNRLKSFQKSNHPLQIMVDHKRLNLLKHPVVGSLLHYKWFKFGLISYIVNLLTYVIYLALLTAFAIHVPNPQSPQCVNTTRNGSKICQSENALVETQTVGLSAVILLLAVARLVFELVQFVSQKLSYLKDWINWVEIAQYTCTVVFMAIYWNDCYCVLQWQWQVGVTAVFLGWIVMILFVTKLPWVGIYVIILTRICVSFLQFVGLILLLIAAFGLTFHMTFFDFQVNRSPFSDVPRSLLKTMTMTTGELDYDAIFRLNPAGESDDLTEIKYPPISYILWIVFLVLMPVILNNMLISLAVDVTNDVQAEAQLRKLALQVDQVLTVQQRLMFFRSCLPKKWKFLKHYRKLTVRRGYMETLQRNPWYKNIFNYQYWKLEVWTNLKFKLWGGDHYDRSTVINAYVVQPSKINLEERLEVMNKEIESIKSTLQAIQGEMETVASSNKQFMNELLSLLAGRVESVQPDSTAGTI